MRGGDILETRQKVLAMLTSAAERGADCPKNGEIADAVGSSTVSAGANWVAKLEKLGLIRVERGSTNRVVTIVATGKRTAGVVKATHWRLGNPDKAKAAAAKTRDTNSTTTPRGYRSVSSQPTGPVPEAIDRDPCFMCGTRHDIGCAHYRVAA